MCEEHLAGLSEQGLLQGQWLLFSRFIGRENREGAEGGGDSAKQSLC